MKNKIKKKKKKKTDTFYLENDMALVSGHLEINASHFLSPQQYLGEGFSRNNQG